MRRDEFLPRPTLLDNLDDLFRDIDAPMIVPPIFEPFGELLAGVMIEHVDVELALIEQPRLGEVTTAQVADDRIDGIGPEQQVELGVK